MVLTRIIGYSGIYFGEVGAWILADAFVALPGGIGTIDEITDVLSLSSLDVVTCPIVLFNTDGYYEPFRALIRNIIENGLGRKEYFDRALFSDDMNEIAEFIMCP